MKLHSYIAGEAVTGGPLHEVFYPWDGSLTGTVTTVDQSQLSDAIARTTGVEMTRYARHAVLRKAAELLASRRSEFAALIRLETGLAAHEAEYETGRTSDVLEFAAMEALRDDGQVFSCDISPAGKSRKIITLRQPVALAAAVTPFNHPLNQVAHKLAPAIAAGTPILLKPSEKTPLSAVRFTELLYEAGLPGPMLSTFVGDITTVVEPLVAAPEVELVCFTGSVTIGKHIAKLAGYKKLCLELGGNSPLIVLDDADLELAVRLAAEGSFRNSGQRCTAVKRILVQKGILGAFTDHLVEVARGYRCGDPADPATRVGTVIDETAAEVIAGRIASCGGQTLLGGGRRGAMVEPTVVADVPRDAELVALETFGPVAPVIPVDDLDDAIDYYNSGPFGLSSAVVTNDLNAALAAAKRLRTGTTNINEVPGYRIESSPFGGVKDSGLGIKEGVIETIKFMTNVKTVSFPW